MFQFPRLSPHGMASHAVAAHDGGWVPPFGNPGIEGRLRLPRAYRGLPRPSSTSDAKASAVRPLYLAPSGGSPGAEGLEHDGTWYLYQKNKRKLLSSAMKMRKRSPLIPLGMQRKLLCANVFHDMEIRYVDIFASNRYAALKVPGNPGGRMLGRKRMSRRGLVRRTPMLRTRSFLNDRVISLERR